MEEAIAINVKFEGNNDDPEIFRLFPKVSWIDLRAMLQAQFDCSENIEVFYIDSDGDYITVSSQEEYDEAKKVAKQCANTLHMKVREFGMEGQGHNQEGQGQTEAQLNMEDEHKNDAIQNKDDTHVVEIPAAVLNEVTESRSAEGTKVKDTILVVDSVTGERIEVKPFNRMNNEMRMHETELLQQKEETEETGAYEKGQPVIKKKKHDLDDHVVIDGPDISTRGSRSVDRGTCSRRRPYDADSGEDVHTLQYHVFVKYMEEMKKELRNDIVKDVTKKTVKQILKGLDGAVIQSSAPTDPSITTVIPKAERKPDPNVTHPIYYHNKVFCDFCEKNILGPRYKCCNCVDYDLCERCEGIYGVHDPTHVFLKLRKPIKFHRKTPLLKQILYKMYQVPSEESQEKHEGEEDVSDETVENLENRATAKMERFRAKLARKHEQLKEKEKKLFEKEKRKEEKLKRKLQTSRGELLLPERPVPTAVEKMKTSEDIVSQTYIRQYMGAKYLVDVTIPDATIVQPGTKLQKTWKMINNGKIPWRESTKLTHLYGDMTTLYEKISVPLLKPGEEGNITVNLIAPDIPGTYKSHWKMVDNNVQFGHRVWCEVVVEPKVMLEVNATPLQIVEKPKVVKPTGVTVAVRCRPLLQRESEASSQLCVELFSHDQPTVVINDKMMPFDFTYQPHDTQEKVYMETVDPVVDLVMEGYNGAVLAYGEKSSGRSFTMTGSIGVEGVIPRSIEAVFQKIAQNKEAEFTVKISYIEIFQEKIYDLLEKYMDRVPLQLKGGRDVKLTVVGMKELEVKSYEDAVQFLLYHPDSSSRISHATYMNYRNSESSFLFMINVTQRKLSGDKEVRESKLILGDLSHSDRKQVREASGATLKENPGAPLNMMQWFRNVVRCVADSNAKFIPYRECKLTRILEKCLGGNSHLVLLACISPAHACQDETKSTLKLAETVRKIHNKPVVNIVKKDQETSDLQVKNVDERVEMFLLEKRSEQRYATTTNSDTNKDVIDKTTLERTASTEAIKNDSVTSNAEDNYEELVKSVAMIKLEASAVAQDEAEANSEVTTEANQQCNQPMGSFHSEESDTADRWILTEDIKTVDERDLARQELSSFEMLNLVSDGPMETATPYNTPLDISPPKSPNPKWEQDGLERMSANNEEVLNSNPEVVVVPDLEADNASCSSVEVMTAEEAANDGTEAVKGEDLKEYLDRLPCLQYKDKVTAGDRSLQPIPGDEFSSDDDSFDEEDDFVVVPLPVCFDTSKPLKSFHLVDESTTDEEEEPQPEEKQRRKEYSLTEEELKPVSATVDEMLSTSRSLTVPPLESVSPAQPEITVTDFAPSEVAMVIAACDVECPPPSECGNVVPLKDENDVGASGKVDNLPLNTETGELSAGNTEVHAQFEPAEENGSSTENVNADGSMPHEEGTGVKVVTPMEDSKGSSSSVSKDMSEGATGGDDKNPNVLVSQVYKKANDIASNAYTTVKEVFYTWQARTYQNGSSQPYKPPQSKWKPKNNKYVPPKSTWKPPTETWVPKEDKEVIRRSESGPMGKLIDMGFCERAKNKELLEKYDNDVEKVIVELLRDMDTDWMNNRH